MSALQLGLALAGAAVVAVLVAWNAWTLRAQRGPDTDGGVLPAPRPDPVEGADDGASPAPPGARIEPTLGDWDSAGAAEQGSSLLDGLIDSIVLVTLDECTVRGDTVLAALPATRRVGSKALVVEAQTPAAVWEAPAAGRDYRALQAGIQLSSRTGPLTEIEFSDFVVQVQRLADALGGTPDFPDMRHEVERARELDQFASRHDVKLRLHVRAQRAAWSPVFVVLQAVGLGWAKTASEGHLVLPAQRRNVPPVLHLRLDTDAARSGDAVEAGLQDLAIILDVPQVALEEQPFERLRDMAAGLAQAMGGIVTDDGGRPLDAAALDAIATSMRTLYAALEERGFPAGSPQAVRLFG